MKDRPGGNAELLPTFSGSLDIYDEDLGAHCDRVGANALAVGRGLGVSEPEHKALRWAGHLHDLGMLAVATAVRHKEGALTDDDWVAIRRHPTIGADTLLAISPELAHVADAVRSHHERWNGSGYPVGAPRNEIPLLGRIVAVVDVFDALTEPRHDRTKAFTLQAATGHLIANRGTLFDPDIVDAFLSLLNRNEIAVSDNAALLSNADATLEYVRHRLDDLVALRASGVWSDHDQDRYLRLAEHEADLLGRMATA
jgi:HD-GYP domain-containing protein (c-di-GMP phosphodiesterase class II)